MRRRQLNTSSSQVQQEWKAKKNTFLPADSSLSAMTARRCHHLSEIHQQIIISIFIVVTRIRPRPVNALTTVPSAAITAANPVCFRARVNAPKSHSQGHKCLRSRLQRRATASFCVSMSN